MKKIMIIALGLFLINSVCMGSIPRPVNSKMKNARVVKTEKNKPETPKPQTRFK
jgi:preprotein translocase subunit SecG